MKKTTPQPNPAEVFAKAAVLVCGSMLEDVRARDPELAAKIDQQLAKGERLFLSCTFGSKPSDAPYIELATKDETGTLKRVGHIRAKMHRIN